MLLLYIILNVYNCNDFGGNFRHTNQPERKQNMKKSSAMRLFTCIFIAPVLLLTIVGCESPQPLPSVIQSSAVMTKAPTVVFDQSNTLTIGNDTYININRMYRRDLPDYAITILQPIKAFENAHAELEIIDWKIEKAGEAYSVFVYGFWISHRPKAGLTPEASSQ